MDRMARSNANRLSGETQQSLSVQILLGLSMRHSFLLGRGQHPAEMEGWGSKDLLSAGGCESLSLQPALRLRREDQQSFFICMACLWEEREQVKES